MRAEETQSSLIPEITQKKTERDTETNIRPRQIAVIGAGIAGLSTAWAFPQRGHQVTIYDQSAPLSRRFWQSTGFARIPNSVWLSKVLII